FNAIYVAQNIGVAIGPLLAGLLAKQGMSHVYIGSFVFAIAFAGYFFFFFHKFDWKSERVSAETKHRKNGAKREFPTKLALCSFILLLLT
ncbi:MFS transporter, partial [Listeria monocytogenes]|nr:MFS transporter [Listeria monocytogenes]